jgi:hypothetical protein
MGVVPVNMFGRVREHAQVCPNWSSRTWGFLWRQAANRTLGLIGVR